MSDTSILHWTLPQRLGERLVAFLQLLASHRRSGGVGHTPLLPLVDDVDAAFDAPPTK